MSQREINTGFENRIKRLEYWLMGLTAMSAGYWMDLRFGMVDAVAYVLGGLFH